ncbi:MAG: hypothetical protein US58_C0010G0004 [Candidatus Magasanikbacteria bacterium GW2011_GWA2_37_8]|uniref:DUF304 domain-containing protein n=1 Tax=Candidatus Magasanikbacteria bacterium GW2011_GWA2_37_8 TaxID=1619036 RepID=A0A0G0HCI7_9BACT|nr:MAG: hypothetical protein US58_C0010G0004 [Candidatus Magasanikbacteria bacterium GW2011_GWA2_37_8]
MSINHKINLRENEEVIHTIRRYLLTYAWAYIFGLAILLASAFFMFWLLNQGWWGEVVLGFGLFIGLFIIFRTWFFNHSNVLVITSERVVDISRLSWFDEVISSAKFTEIKDIFIRRRGLSANMFNYGTITLETKNQGAVLELAQVHQPQKIQSLIVEAIENFRHLKKFSSQKSLYEGFIKTIPELTEEELCLVRDLIDNQLEEYDDQESEVDLEIDEVV